MDRHMREELDRHITGNYGEDQLQGGVMQAVKTFIVLERKEVNPNHYDPEDFTWALCYPEHFTPTIGDEVIEFITKGDEGPDDCFYDCDVCFVDLMDDPDVIALGPAT